MRPRQRPTSRPTLVLFALALAVAGTAFAQSGKLTGRVTATDGSALAGATVTIESPDLLGGPRVTTTDAEGGFDFPTLAPGTYTVRVALDGFATQEKTAVEVRLNRTTELRVQLSLAMVADEVVVTADTPVVDPERVSTSQNFSLIYLENAAIGTANRSYQDVLIQAPGVTDIADGGGNPNVFGSTFQENAYYIDGSNTTDVVTETFATNFNFDAIKEISFQTAGYEAQYGSATGGVIDVITKSGGNSFSGTLDLRYDDESFRESGEFFDPDRQKQSNFDPAATLGGPVVRDKLWFFTSYEQPQTEFQATGSLTSRDFEGRYYLGKLSFQLTPNWTLVGQTSGDPATIDNVARPAASVLPEAQAKQEQGGNITQASALGVVSPSLLFDFKASRNRQELDLTPQVGDLETPGFQNLTTGEFYGNYQNAQFSNRDRDEAKASLSYFLDGFAGSHEFKGGVEYSDLSFRSANFTTGDYRYTTRIVNDVEILRDFNFDTDRSFTDSTGEVRGAYLQDSWDPLPNLTLKLGLRYDRSEFTNNIGERVVDFTKVQPRIGAAWDVQGDGKTILRANWGRFMHPASTRLSSVAAFDDRAQPRINAFSCEYLRQQTFGLPPGSGVPCEEIAAIVHDVFGFEGSIVQEPRGFDPDGWVAASIIGATGEGLLIDPNLEPTYADTWIVSAERKVLDRSSIELSYVQKDTKDIFEDTCVGNVDGSRDPGNDCSNFEVTNLPELTRSYEGAILKFESRAVDWLHVLSSLTWSESKGSIESTQYAGGDYDFYPDDFVNRFGYLADHRKLRFKLNGYAQLPAKLTLGVGAFWSSPFVYNVVDAAGSTGSSARFVEPRGSREGNENYQLDLQLSRALDLGPVDLSLIGSVINVASSERPTARCGDISGCTVGADRVDLGDPIAWQRPRSYQAGVRIVF